METKRYQVIELEVTYQLAKSVEKIEEERQIVQRLMQENNIEFVLELVEEGNGETWVLELMVPKEDAERVIAILDAQGGLGYTVDFEETLLVSDDNMELVNEYDTKDSYQEYIGVSPEVKQKEERIRKALHQENAVKQVEEPVIDFSDGAVENVDDEYTKGINKPKKTIIDYLIYIVVILIVVKFLMSMFDIAF
ncbi:MAG: hypothetical protein IKJ36_02910 [Clostridia bacterium]|nr:hypothetical protein [Clostridia bacterium]